MKLHSLAPVGLVLATVVVAGCSSSLPALPVANVTGTVTLDGKPLDQGTIAFATDGRPPQVFEIRDGKFNGAAMVGNNVISISSKKPMTFAGGKDPSGGRLGKGNMGRPPEAGGAPPKGPEEEILPVAYNTNSKETRVVESGGANKFDFDIKLGKK